MLEPEVIARYLTPTGRTGLAVMRHGPNDYRFSGAWGAGCGTDKTEIERRVMRIIGHRRGLRVVKAFE